MIVVRVRYKELGAHVHCRIFVGSGAQGSTFAKSGELIFNAGQEWDDFKAGQRSWEFLADQPRYYTNGLHCEICAPQKDRLEYHRCIKHMEDDSVETRTTLSARR